MCPADPARDPLFLEKAYVEDSEDTTAEENRQT
jgi:hypothetical protein